MDGVARTPLTVDFREPGFIAALHAENQQPFWFQLSAEERQPAGSPWGPRNPQALNRYSYVQNTPLRYTDPSGHHLIITRQEASEFQYMLDTAIAELSKIRDSENFWFIVGAAATGGSLAGISLPVGAAAGLAGFLGGLQLGAPDFNGTAEAIANLEWMSKTLGTYMSDVAADAKSSIFFNLERTNFRYEPDLVNGGGYKAVYDGKLTAWWGEWTGPPLERPVSQSFYDRLERSALVTSRWDLWTSQGIR
jgi:hypothetical protein